MRNILRSFPSLSGEDLAPTTIKSDSCWFLYSVEVIGSHGFLDVLAQCFPVIGFRDNVFGQALCYKAAVAFLGYFENNLVHADQITALASQSQGGSVEEAFRSRKSGRRRFPVKRTPATGFDRCSQFIGVFLEALLAGGDQPCICWER